MTFGLNILNKRTNVSYLLTVTDITL